MLLIGRILHRKWTFWGQHDLRWTRTCGAIYSLEQIRKVSDIGMLETVGGMFITFGACSMLYIEAPAGVGFSYADSQSGYTTNDSVTADNNYEAIQKFFAAYSEYRSHEFFLSGESYAGVYVPTLAYQILQRAGRNGDASINLKGILGKI